MTRMTLRLTLLCLGIASGATSRVAAAHKAINVGYVKQLTGGVVPICSEPVSVFEVRRDGVNPKLRIMVTLKPADSIAAQDIELRIVLLDERGKVVRLLDSTQVEASTNPPWTLVQIASDGMHQLDIDNRLPPQDRIGPRYRLRVSLDTSDTDAPEKAGVETKPFLLYWTDRGEQLCKSIP